MATEEQVQSIIDLNESGDRTLTGWDQTKGQYKHPSNYPAELNNAKKKKTEFPVQAGKVYKLVSNWPTLDFTLYKNGVSLGTYAAGVSHSIDGLSWIWWLNGGGSTAGGVWEVSAPTTDITPLLDIKVDTTDIIVTDGSDWTDVGIWNSDYSTEAAYLSYGITGAFSSFSSAHGFTYDQGTMIISGPNS